MVIDVFSKRAWCVPLKNKSASSLLKEHGVHHFSNHNEETKASIVETFNRTLKTRMWRYFTKYQTVRYIDALQDFVQSYNETYHRSMGMAPSYGHDGKGVSKFKVDDRVRISKPKRRFEKGYMANWSELFTIREVHVSDPPVYRLVDDLGEVLDGTFYEPELQKVLVSKDKLYRVESLLQRRKVGKRTEALVKWYGYPTRFEKPGVFPFNRDVFTHLDVAPSSVTDRPASQVVDATPVLGNHDVPENNPIPCPAGVTDIHGLPTGDPTQSSQPGTNRLSPDHPDQQLNSQARSSV